MSLFFDRVAQLIFGCSDLVSILQSFTSWAPSLFKPIFASGCKASNPKSKRRSNPSSNPRSYPKPIQGWIQSAMQSPILSCIQDQMTILTNLKLNPRSSKRFGFPETFDRCRPPRHPSPHQINFLQGTIFTELPFGATASNMIAVKCNTRTILYAQTPHGKSLRFPRCINAISS